MGVCLVSIKIHLLLLIPGACCFYFFLSAELLFKQLSLHSLCTLGCEVVWPWASSFISLCLLFLFIKIRETITPTSQGFVRRCQYPQQCPHLLGKCSSCYYSQVQTTWYGGAREMCTHVSMWSSFPHRRDLTPSIFCHKQQ